MAHPEERIKVVKYFSESLHIKNFQIHSGKYFQGKWRRLKPFSMILKPLHASLCSEMAKVARLKTKLLLSQVTKALGKLSDE